MRELEKRDRWFRHVERKTGMLSLAHLFYAHFTHGPNTSASAQYDNTRGAWLTQEGCTMTERKAGRCSNNNMEHGMTKNEVGRC